MLLDRTTSLRVLAASLTLCLGTLRSSPAQAQDDGMHARYERAGALQAAEHDRWLLNQRVYPHWIDGSRFWYKRDTSEGYSYTLVDAEDRGVTELFDHAALAAVLNLAREDDTVEVNANALPLRMLRVRGDPLVAEFSAFGKNWRYAIAQRQLEEAGQTADPGLLVAPDGKKGAFLKGHDLWLRDLESGEESALTTDGQPFYAYGVVPNATGRPATKPEAVWSPDSKRLLTAQVDDRQVLEMPVINFAPSDGSVRPTASSVRAALPGDAHVTRFRMLAIDVETTKQVAAHYPTLPAARMNDTPLGGNRAWWAADGNRAYFVEIERGEQTVNVVEFDVNSGATRVVFTETSDTYIDLAPNVYGPASIVPLPETNELVWYSERSGWAHLYLYDLIEGRLVRQLTQGDWLVRDVVDVDRERRQLYITLAGKAPDKDPYYREVARVGLDTGELTVLSKSDADHLLFAPNDFGLLILSFLGEDVSTVSGLAPGPTRSSTTSTVVPRSPTFRRDSTTTRSTSRRR